MSDRPIECRALRRDERQAWEPLFAGYQDFYRVSLGDAVVDTTWRRFHDPAEPMFAAGAFAEPVRSIIPRVRLVSARDTG